MPNNVRAPATEDVEVARVANAIHDLAHADSIRASNAAHHEATDALRALAATLRAEREQRRRAGEALAWIDTQPSAHFTRVGDSTHLGFGNTLLVCPTAAEAAYRAARARDAGEGGKQRNAGAMSTSTRQPRRAALERPMSTSEMAMTPDATPADPFHAVRGTLAFFRSAIRSGEEWDSVCEAAYQRAVAALDTATPAQPEPRTPDETLAANVQKLAEEFARYTDVDARTLRDAAKRLRELAADMRWLEHMVVNVRSPTPYGSLDVFWASPPDEGDGPSDLRKLIADARQQRAQGGTE